MDKKKLVVSFSGGETSAYMAKWLIENKSDEYEMVFVFANTGQENEETLIFADKCDKLFNMNLVWVEGVHYKEVGKGTSFKIVDFETASRNGEPFESFISVYGIPNQPNPTCTGALKANPINAFVKSLGWKDYYTAIGIRYDEIDRIAVDRVKRKLYYPLCESHPTTKQAVNLFWRDMPFRLNLKGYQGNCKWCWKKSKPKLLQLAKEDKSIFDFPAAMEKKYGNYFPEQRAEKWRKEGKELPSNITFFRNNESAIDIVNQSLNFNKYVRDDSVDFDVQLSIIDDSESCEIWSNCGDK